MLVIVFVALLSSVRGQSPYPYNALGYGYYRRVGQPGQHYEWFGTAPFCGNPSCPEGWYVPTGWDDFREWNEARCPHDSLAQELFGETCITGEKQFCGLDLRKCCSVENSQNIEYCKYKGNDDACGRKWLDEGEGDCDNDWHCKGGLVCGENNCPWGDGDDCCVAAEAIEAELGQIGAGRAAQFNVQADHNISMVVTGFAVFGLVFTMYGAYKHYTKTEN